MEDSPQVSSPQKASYLFFGQICRDQSGAADKEVDGYDIDDVGSPTEHWSLGFSFYLMNGFIKNTLRQQHPSPQTFQETQ